ncbi:uncharacterized protein RHIMIDRAFT_271513 [Rhizopus microsporus ATCC 52813]|uniref:C2H2-type domain-containing protein n=1 Tax=Rhizopus microsporus ATCC 52813 TaxID=1340429 RepID=A0A2G4T2B0_RHIZD|nr:uncharacterized protein RHIMIDRAFT_271513 [Rhizopus microsporus ATCC 52813]PHZ15151.1 hypothetical protein RHIMIDRAFT_271513 [Rhizopus microsporus ATCC 52813]
MNHYCNVCSLSFETDIKLANHKYDAHIDLVKASFGDGKKRAFKTRLFHLNKK